MNITKPDYISQNMFDRVLRELSSLNTTGADLRQQMILLMQLLRGSADYAQILVDIQSVIDSAKTHTAGRRAEIAFVMGMQLGFELALAYPPLASDHS
jgi:hypothetical protein